MVRSTDSYYSMNNRSKDISCFKSTEISFHFPAKKLFLELLLFLDSSLRLVTITVIVFYQRYLSPRKGYSCAHRRLRGGDSCSEYVKKTLGDKSLFETTLLTRRRFRECNAAYIYLKNRSFEPEDLTRVSVGPPPPDDPFSCIIYIIVAILSLIFGKQCCNK